MQGLAIVLAAASLGVDYGWQPTDDGTLEYIIQIEPELLIALQKGESIVSEIHPAAAGVRRFRIQIGSQPLPRIARTDQPAAKKNSEEPASGVPLSLEPAPPAATTFPVPAPSQPLTPPAENAVEAGNVPGPTASEAVLPPIRSEFPIPANEVTLPDGAARPATPPVIPPTTFPIDESDFPVTEPLGVDAENAAAPLPLPASELADPQTPPGRPAIVPLPDPDRQPLDGIQSEPSFPEEPLPVDKSRPAIPATSATAIPAIDGTQLATFNKTSDKSPLPPTASIAAENRSATSPDVAEPRPWLLLSVTILGLLASLGTNAYLGYLFMGTQRRYHNLRQETRLQGQ